MGAADGLLDDAVDNLEVKQLGRGDAQPERGFVGFRAVFPKNGGAPFWGDHAVDAVFEDMHAVGNTEGERAARAAFTDDRGDDGHADARHGGEARADGFALPALLGANAWVGAGSVDERKNGHVEAIGELVEAAGFAVAFWLGLTKVAGGLFLRGAAFLMADNNDTAPTVKPYATDDGCVVAKAAIAMQLDEVFKKVPDVIECVRAVRVAAKLDFLPRRQIRKELACNAIGPFFETAKLGFEALVAFRQGA